MQYFPVEIYKMNAAHPGNNSSKFCLTYKQKFCTYHDLFFFLISGSWHACDARWKCISVLSNLFSSSSSPQCDRKQLWTWQTACNIYLFNTTPKGKQREVWVRNWYVAIVFQNSITFLQKWKRSPVGSERKMGWRPIYWAIILSIMK